MASDNLFTTGNWEGTTKVISTSSEIMIDAIKQLKKMISLSQSRQHLVSGVIFRDAAGAITHRVKLTPAPEHCVTSYQYIISNVTEDNFKRMLPLSSQVNNSHHGAILSGAGFFSDTNNVEYVLFELCTSRSVKSSLTLPPNVESTSYMLNAGFYRYTNDVLDLIPMLPYYSSHHLIGFVTQIGDEKLDPVDSTPYILEYINEFISVYTSEASVGSGNIEAAATSLLALIYHIEEQTFQAWDGGYAIASDEKNIIPLNWRNHFSQSMKSIGSLPTFLLNIPSSLSQGGKPEGVILKSTLMQLSATGAGATRLCVLTLSTIIGLPFTGTLTVQIRIFFMHNETLIALTYIHLSFVEAFVKGRDCVQLLDSKHYCPFLYTFDIPINANFFGMVITMMAKSGTFETFDVIDLNLFEFRSDELPPRAALAHAQHVSEKIRALSRRMKHTPPSRPRLPEIQHATERNSSNQQLPAVSEQEQEQAESDTATDISKSHQLAVTEISKYIETVKESFHESTGNKVSAIFTLMNEVTLAVQNIRDRPIKPETLGLLESLEHVLRIQQQEWTEKERNREKQDVVCQASRTDTHWEDLHQLLRGNSKSRQIGRCLLVIGILLILFHIFLIIQALIR